MNFLAHFFLSQGREKLLVGNFLADYIGNRRMRQYPEPIQEGVRLHRMIDSYTDNHPEVLKGVRRLYSDHSKYAPVVIDIFYDYLLAFNWRRYSSQSLDAFTQEVYEVLGRHMEIMPEGLKKHLPHMIADDWLKSYASHNGIADAFRRLKQRVSRPKYLNGALDSLIRDFGPLNEEFNIFFPDIIKEVDKQFLQLPPDQPSK